MNPEKASYRDYRRRLVVGFALLVLMLALALSWKLRASYVDDRRTALAQTFNFGRAMDAYVSNVIQFVDLALTGSADALESLDAAQLHSPETVRQLLAASGRTPDTNFWLIFLDADGNGVVSSNGLAIDGISYADRPYFAAHATGVDVGLFVDGPQVGRVSGRRLFFLSRAVRASSGRLLGVVAAPVDASVLAGVFQSALFQPGLSVVLAHTGGKAIARAPRFEESFGLDVRGSMLFRQLKHAPSGTYEAKSAIEGDDRLYSYRTMNGLPLVLAVGVARSSWTVGLFDDLLVAGVGLVVIVTILFFSGRFALDNYRRLEASEAEHRHLNAALQVTRGWLAHSEDRMRLVTDHVPALVAYIDADERYTFRNAAFTRYEGIDADAMIGRTLREVHGDADYSLVADEIALALKGQPVVFERARVVYGVTHHWKHVYTPDIVEGGRVAGLYAIVTDLTERKLVEQDLQSLARVDALTGLPNRHQLYEQLQIAIARCRRASTKVVCLYLDIDHFKVVNDTLGHAAGDELLRQFAARLQACVRQTDLVARIAGDEFIIVSEGVESVAAASIIATKIIDAMQAPFVIEGEGRQVTTSIGAVVSTGRDETPDSLLKKADALLYQAKRLGKDQFQVVDASADIEAKVPSSDPVRRPPISRP